LKLDEVLAFAEQSTEVVEDSLTLESYA